jgi:hypothetical protein
MPGWCGRIRTSIWRIRNRMVLPAREDLQNSHFIGIHKQLETLEFREPYRTRGVQSSGENCAVRRRMVGLCRLEIRNSNQKSLLILGLIANILAQRTGGCSDAGGGRGAGLKPSPRIQQWSRGNGRTLGGGVNRCRSHGQIVGPIPRPCRPEIGVSVDASGGHLIMQATAASRARCRTPAK